MVHPSNDPSSDLQHRVEEGGPTRVTATTTAVLPSPSCTTLVLVSVLHVWALVSLSGGAYWWTTPTVLLRTLEGQESACDAERLGYRTVACPRWAPRGSNTTLPPSDDVDDRLRYMWRRQHPADCGKASYWVKASDDNVGFGALMAGHYAGPFAGALRSDRVFMVEPDYFPYAGCANDSSWTCYFEPLTNCSYERHVRPLLDPNRSTSDDWKHWQNGSYRVISTTGYGNPEFFHPGSPLDGLPPSVTFEQLNAAVYMYLLRLNARTQARVNERIQQIIPCDLDPERTIALPIRASDKCIGKYRQDSSFGGESSCPDFETYMALAEEIRDNHPQVDTILLSSEDARFVEARHNYTSAHGRRPWRIVVNSRDVMQGSGDRQRLNGHTLDDVFMSFYTTLQMQMRANYFILNCESNFHKLLRMLVVDGGCGFTPSPVILCMNDQGTRFRICSVWDPEGFEECMRQKEVEGLEGARARLRRLLQSSER